MSPVRTASPEAELDDFIRPYEEACVGANRWI